MTYLGYPRLHFAGRFQADVPTVNNIAAYQDNNVFEPRFQRDVVPPKKVNGLWNPRGTGSFRLHGCAVTSTVRANGEPGAFSGYVADDDTRVSAKIVDLDVSDQSASVIYGLRMRLVDEDGREWCRGDFEPSPLTDLWARFFPIQPGDRGNLSAYYQSVLTNVTWADNLADPLLRELRDTTADGILSVKFVVDDVEIFPDHPAVTYGRVVGAIGAYTAGEPRTVVAGRRLRSITGALMNHAPCMVNERTGTVFVDLGNSLPVSGTGGPTVDLGPLRLAVLTEDGPTVLADLGTVDDKLIEHQAGIVTAQLAPDQLATIKDRPLAILNPAGVQLTESTDGLFVGAEPTVYRLSPGQRAIAAVVATRFGRPTAVTVSVGSEEKPAGLDYPGTVTTGPDGRADLVFTARDPGHPRPHSDGQTYQVTYGFAQPEGALRTLVWDPAPVPKRPIWVTDVQPIFQQYANLYPAMRDVLDLSNYHHVVAYRESIRASMLLPVESPNHMPVSRTLSPGKRDMIVKWLDTKPHPPILAIDTPKALRSALQQAMLVEQAVVTPYLCALFTIKPDRNVVAAEIIRRVAREEMLHMALAGNMLNAVGGRPVIGRPGFVPAYPGHLPGPVLPDLQLRLRKFSPEYVKDTFLAIERPEHPIVDGQPFTGAVIRPDSVDVDAGVLRNADGTAMRQLEEWFGKAEYNPMTIGWFYNQIARAIIRLDRAGSLFTGDPVRQVSWPDAPGQLYRVTDRQTALLAIYEIIEQGEGSPHDLDGDNILEAGELGHYYRFNEIVHGRRLVRNKRGKWEYAGEEIPFDPDGVYPMVDDPDGSLLPDGSRAKAQSDVVNGVFTNLLTSLNRVFNGHPDELGDAMGLMYSLGIEGRRLLALPSAPAATTVAGPSFQSSAVPW